MKLIDPHIHMTSRITDDYEHMKKAGYVTVIEPAFWSGTDRSCAGSYYDYFNHLLEFENIRSKHFGIKHYCFLGVNAKEARNTDISNEVIDNLPKYLNHPNCLGVGEIGLDLITNDEEEVFRKQIQIANQNRYLVIIHLPHNFKIFGIKRICKILDQENVDFKYFIMDHNTEETINITLDYQDMMAGITLYPTKVTIERALQMILKYGPERILLNSSADWGKSYPLNVSDAAMYFKKVGIDNDIIEKVVYENAYNFFSQSPNWKL